MAKKATAKAAKKRTGRAGGTRKGPNRRQVINYLKNAPPTPPREGSGRKNNEEKRSRESSTRKMAKMFPTIKATSAYKGKRTKRAEGKKYKGG